MKKTPALYRSGGQSTHKSYCKCAYSNTKASLLAVDSLGSVEIGDIGGKIGSDGRAKPAHHSQLFSISWGFAMNQSLEIAVVVGELKGNDGYCGCHGRVEYSMIGECPKFGESDGKYTAFGMAVGTP